MNRTDALIAFHDWRVRLRMERAYRGDGNPYPSPDKSELGKRAALVALLSDRSYLSALDVGCAQGGLTREIAKLCGRVLATDISGAAIWRAMVNLSDLSNVAFARRNVREDDDLGGWDLIVLSDVLPFLDAGVKARSSLQGVCRRLAARLNPAGRIAIVNPLSVRGQFLDIFGSDPRLRLRHELITAGDAPSARQSIAVYERPAAAATGVAGGPSERHVPADRIRFR